jgi:secreted trypsin-like serine protease
MKIQGIRHALFLMLAIAGELTACEIAGAIESDAQAITSATDDEGHPHVVALVNGPRVLCTGTLIAEAAVLTAAHCFTFERPTEVEFSATPGASPGARARIVHVTLHPDYDGGIEGAAHDLAVATLAAPSPLAPARVASEAAVSGLAGQQVTIVGFGKIDATDRSASHRRMGLARVDAVTPATWLYSPGPSNTCAKDSGGPAFIASGGLEYLVGVASEGDTFCRGGGAFARVDGEAAFLERAMQPQPGAPGCTLGGPPVTAALEPGLAFLLICALGVRRRRPGSRAW